MKQAFTLIELLVVIAIIGILIAVGSVSYQRTVMLSRDSKRRTDLEQLRQALETYRSQNDAYPTTGAGLAVLTPNYVSTLPTDPKATSGYSYTYTQNSSATYSLCATLEGAANPSYCVTQP